MRMFAHTRRKQSIARFKVVDRSSRFTPVVLESQLVPACFEHALDVLVDTETDLSGLPSRFSIPPNSRPSQKAHNSIATKQDVSACFRHRARAQCPEL